MSVEKGEKPTTSSEKFEKLENLFSFPAVWGNKNNTTKKIKLSVAEIRCNETGLESFNKLKILLYYVESSFMPSTPSAFKFRRKFPNNTGLYCVLWKNHMMSKNMSPCYCHLLVFRPHIWLRVVPIELFEVSLALINTVGFLVRIENSVFSSTGAAKSENKSVSRTLFRE